MAKTIDEIMNSMLQTKATLQELNALEVLTSNEKNTLNFLTTASTSKVAAWRLQLYICAVAVWALENVFDVFKKEIEEKISLNKIGTSNWYREQILAFQLGYSLNEMGVYDNTGLTTAQVQASKIVKQAAVEEVGNRLRVKVASENEDGELIPLTAEQMQAFIQYCQLFKYAGTRLLYISRIPDDFKLSFTIFYDPQILNLSGARLDGTDNEPVQNAVKNYLRNLKFNGEFSNTRLTDEVQLVDGVEEPRLDSSAAKYGLFDYAAITEYYIADAGYMKLDEMNTNFNFVPREF